MKFWQRLANLFYRGAHYCDKKAGVKPLFGKRVCAGCNKAIKRSEHWRFASLDGRPRHWNCEAPERVLPMHLHKMIETTEKIREHMRQGKSYDPGFNGGNGAA